MRDSGPSKETAQKAPVTTRPWGLVEGVLSWTAFAAGLAALALLALALAGLAPLAAPAAGLALLPAFALALWLSRLGRARPAAWLAMLSLLLAALFWDLQPGLAFAAIFGYTLSCLGAALIAGAPAGLAFALLSGAAHFTAAFLRAGRAPAPPFPLEANYVAQAVALGLALSIFAPLARLFHREIQAARQRERQLVARLEAQGVSLEEEIEEQSRAQELRQHRGQAAASVIQALLPLQEEETLLTQAAELLQEQFGLYHAGLYLPDAEGSYAVLRAAAGEAAESLLSEGHKQAVGGESPVGWAAANGKQRLTHESDPETFRSGGPHLPDSRAELALPLLAGERLLGVLSLHAGREAGFDAETLRQLAWVAGCLSAMLENARRLQEVRASLDELQDLHRRSLTGAWQEALERLGPIAYTSGAQSGAEEGAQVQVETLPLKLREGQVGAITIEREGPPLGAEERAVLEAVALHAVLSLENARLLQEAQRLARREQMINRISSEIRSSMEADTILQDTVRELGQALGASRAFIQIGLPENSARPPQDAASGGEGQNRNGSH